MLEDRLNAMKGLGTRPGDLLVPLTLWASLLLLLLGGWKLSFGLTFAWVLHLLLASPMRVNRYCFDLLSLGRSAFTALLQRLPKGSGGHQAFLLRWYSLIGLRASKYAKALRQERWLPKKRSSRGRVSFSLDPNQEAARDSLRDLVA